MLYDFKHTLPKYDQILLLLDVESPSCQSISIMNCESYYILHTFDSDFFMPELQLLKVELPTPEGPPNPTNGIQL